MSSRCGRNSCSLPPMERGKSLGFFGLHRKMEKDTCLVLGCLWCSSFLFPLHLVHLLLSVLRMKNLPGGLPLLFLHRKILFLICHAVQDWLQFRPKKKITQKWDASQLYIRGCIAQPGLYPKSPMGWISEGSWPGQHPNGFGWRICNMPYSPRRSRKCLPWRYPS